LALLQAWFGAALTAGAVGSIKAFRRRGIKPRSS